ncbi:MAG: hypothetical protein P1U63_09645 [Coxiellaceae bacterium]|nr:hypothetical protein [Coxiellaceae bacterium]
MSSVRVRNLQCKLGSALVVAGLLSVAVLGCVYNNRVCDDGNEDIMAVLMDNACVIGSHRGNANETVVLNAAKACFAICAGISANNMSAIDESLSAASGEMSRLVSASTASLYHGFMGASMIVGLIGFVCLMTTAVGLNDVEESTQTPEAEVTSDIERPLISNASLV